MRRLLIISVICFISVILTFLILKPPQKIAVEKDLKFHPSVFYEKTTFLKGVEYAKSQNKHYAQNIAGGIIPHHLLPGYILADFFKRLQKQDPKTIILMGPNHNERGTFNVLSSDYGWETPYGNVHPDLEKINLLVSQGTAKIDNTVLPNDHAVAGSLPFLKYYLPHTKIVPLLLSGFMKIDDAEMLSRNLEKIIDKDTIVISAVDFSHYLSIEEADKNDEVSLALIKDNDYRKIMSLNNDYLDSPASIVTLLMTMKSLKTDQMSVLHHDNSGKITKNNREGTTSYYSIIFYEK